jgi:hypothetical protein
MLSLLRPIGLVGLTTAAVLAAYVIPSDPIGCFALVDRVVLLPDSVNPKTIQIWGAFVQTAAIEMDGEQIVSVEIGRYANARRGYLYYTLNPKNPTAALAEWKDLQRVAGTGMVIGFGGAFENVGTIRRLSAPAGNPDVYPMGFGLTMAPQARRVPGITSELLHVPAAIRPADGATVTVGRVTLAARNIADGGVKYLFEIEGPGGVKESSPPVIPGRERETTWTPALQLRAGTEYTWSVRTINSLGGIHQPDVATFQTAK